MYLCLPSFFFIKYLLSAFTFKFWFYLNFFYFSYNILIIFFSSPTSSTPLFPLLKKKEKKKDKQNLVRHKISRQKHSKNPTRTRSAVCSRLANHSWAWGLLWNVVDVPSEPPLKKTYLPFFSRHQLQITVWLGVGLCPRPLLSVEILSGLNLCRSCA